MASDAHEPERIDLEALDLGPMLRHARTATFAPNWKSVLLADALIGLAIVTVGVVLLRWVALLGLPVIAIGVVYCFLVTRRFLQWRWIRRRAGLDHS